MIPDLPAGSRISVTRKSDSDDTFRLLLQRGEQQHLIGIHLEEAELRWLCTLLESWRESSG